MYHYIRCHYKRLLLYRYLTRMYQNLDSYFHLLLEADLVKSSSSNFYLRKFSFYNQIWNWGIHLHFILVPMQYACLMSFWKQEINSNKLKSVKKKIKMHQSSIRLPVNHLWIASFNFFTFLEGSFNWFLRCTGKEESQDHEANEIVNS